MAIMVPFGAQNNTPKYWVRKKCPRGSYGPLKMGAPVLIYENENFGVHACVTYGWKGLEERNKL